MPNHARAGICFVQQGWVPDREAMQLNPILARLYFYLKISSKKLRIASQERRSAASLYPTPFIPALPDSGLVKLCTALP